MNDEKKPNGVFICCPACNGNPLLGVNFEDGSAIECSKCEGTGSIFVESPSEQPKMMRRLPDGSIERYYIHRSAGGRTIHSIETSPPPARDLTLPLGMPFDYDPALIHAMLHGKGPKPTRTPQLDAKTTLAQLIGDDIMHGELDDAQTVVEELPFTVAELQKMIASSDEFEYENEREPLTFYFRKKRKENR